MLNLLAIGIGSVRILRSGWGRPIETGMFTRRGGLDRSTGRWASSAVAENNRRFRRYLWNAHPVGGFTAFVGITVVTAGDPRPSLFIITIVYALLVAAIRFIGPNEATAMRLWLMGLVDIAVIGSVSLEAPSLWPAMAFLALGVISIGWIESPAFTASLLTTAILLMSVTGIILGIDSWWLTIGAMTHIGAAMSVAAFFVSNDVLLEQFSTALDSLKMVVWKSDADGVLTEVVGHVDIFSGIAPADLVGQNLMEFVSPDSVDWLIGEIVEAKEEIAISGVHNILHADGPRAARSSFQAVDTRHGKEIRGVTIDISSDWTAGEAQRRNASIVEHMRDGLIIVALDQDTNSVRIDKVNDAAQQLLGVEDSPSWQTLVAEAPLLAEKILGQIRSIGKDSQSENRWEYQTAGQDGLTWIQVVVFDLSESAVAAQLVDITEDKNRHANAMHQASHDGLTKLLNATAFRDQLAAILTGELRAPIVFLLDLDRFKPINDEHGHAAGDAVLIQISRRLENCLKDGDLIARLGGDEFIGFVDGMITNDEAERLMQRIEAVCAEPVTIGADLVVRVCGSAGYSRPSESPTVEGLLRTADEAMYRRKSTKVERTSR